MDQEYVADDEEQREHVDANGAGKTAGEHEGKKDTAAKKKRRKPRTLVVVKKAASEGMTRSESMSTQKAQSRKVR